MDKFQRFTVPEALKAIALGLVFVVVISVLDEALSRSFGTEFWLHRFIAGMAVWQASINIIWMSRRGDR